MNKRIVVIISTWMSVVAHAAPVSDVQAAGTPTVNKVQAVTAVKAQPTVTENAAVTEHAAKEADLSSRVGGHETLPVDTVNEDAAGVDAAALPEAPALDVHGQTAEASTQTNTGLYVGIEGVQRGVHLGHRGVHGDQWAHQQHVRANGARFSLGYQLNDNLALELGYMTGMTTANAHTIPSGVVSYTARQRLTGGDVSVIYRFTDGIPGLYVRGGASYMALDGQSVKTNRMRYRDRKGTRIHPDVLESRHDAGLGLVAGIGYEAAVTDHIGVHVAYTRYQGIAGDSKNAMNMLSVGAKYRF